MGVFKNSPTIGSISEIDPKIGTTTINGIPKWNGSQLIDSSSIFENESGKVGIGINNPSEKLHVNGNIKAEGIIYGDLSGNAKSADNATSATNADHAETADNATEAGHAATADTATEADHATSYNETDPTITDF